ncbi:putative Histidine kinase [Desulfamplus magnetovallimortis]|uniref:histidine kinase n=1 Tax=Desulfamplus magnetovallimortis TaxID=1246637 RepID=A0A1W1H6W8_9BACT|nr:ATP-binding protein [Desulfamplus magnetovallimortis]SLM28176.1 putative Histidine kinase [Desulfamplus magnetovallimortis]
MNPQKSVKIKLMASFIAVTAFMVLSTLLNFYILFFFRNTLDKITTQDLPPLILAQQLAAQSERIVASAPSLIASADEKERTVISGEINSEIENLSRIFGQLGNFALSIGMVRELESDFRDFTGYVSRIDQTVRKKLVLTEAQQRRYTQLLETYKKSEEIINPAISVFRVPVDQWIEMNEGMMADDVAAKVEQLLHLVNIRMTTSSLTKLLLSVATEQNEENLNLIKLKCLSNLADMSEQSEELIPQLSNAYGQLIAEFHGYVDYLDYPDSIPEIRREILKTISDAGLLSKECVELSRKINAVVQILIEKTRTDVQATTSKARFVWKTISTILVLVFIASLAVSIIMGWQYIEKRVIRPIEELAGAAREIEAGNLERQVMVESDDEIGNLATAFNSMVIKRKDAELSLRNARDELEHRVQERTQELSVKNDQLNDEIRERIASEKMRKELEIKLLQSQKLEAVGTLSGGIAHDFNNILVPIIGYTEMMLDDLAAGNPLRESLNEIYSAAMRARGLVQQILTFSRQETDEFHEMNLEPVIKEALKLIRATIPATIKMEQDIRSDCGMIKANPTQIHQIVMNLTTNAYHAMEESGGELNVTLKEIELGEHDATISGVLKGRYACLTVADTGKGMTEEVKEKIFDPFFTTKDVGKGTGMGLSVVHGIVTKMGGFINVDSQHGQGSKFHVYLPMAGTDFSDRQDYKEEKEIQGGTEHILLVDDEESLIRMEKRMLERLGYKVTSCASAIEAIETCMLTPDVFDIVITDMAMPGMSGDKLAAELTRLRPDIPVLLCTGFSEIMSEEKALSLGIKGFLMKPVIMKDLSLKIREVLENT